MTVKDTLQLGNPALRTTSAAVPDEDLPHLTSLADDLGDTLQDWITRTGYGRGIAAPQVGVPRRVVLVPLNEHELLVNPVITARSAEHWEPWEVCLSFSVQFFCKVRRATRVEVEYRSTDGGHHRRWVDGALAQVLQHEVDHLDGVLATDRMTAPPTLCLRSEFEQRHLDESPYHR